jgi:deoxycytidine triphosphate deaminase
MSIVSRDELIEAFKSGRLKIEDPDNEINAAADRPYALDNPFQPCSIDIHVGFIYVPETEPEEQGGALYPNTDEYGLGVGHTLMIRTKEEITLPEDMGGICFSPSRLALKAILVTNMGHVDPGYSGHLHFAAINMGKEPYTFRRNDVICSMIFFKLSHTVPAYGKEHFVEAPGKAEKPIPEAISKYFPKLSRDFVDVEKRAQSIAKAEVEKTKLFQIITPILAAAIIAAIPLFQLWVTKPWENQINQLSCKVEGIEKTANFEGRIKTLEDKISQQKAELRPRSMRRQGNS